MFQGRVNTRLNSTGIKQAACLAEAMKNIPLKAVYSSSLRRAVETAGIVASYHPHAMTRQFEDLEEMSFGELEGHPHGEYTETMNEIYEKWSQGDFHAKFPSGECPMDVVKRGTQTIHDIMTQSMNEHILIVTHGRFNKIVLSYLVHANLHSMHTVTQDNTCVNVLDFDFTNGKYAPVLINDTTHLNC
jgi:broad specificity phosphatase PhoE